MSDQYKHNHYVPIWYQKRFLPEGQEDNELYYLDFNPPVYVDPRGKGHLRKAVRKQGLRLCFSEDDLYTRKIDGSNNTEIEQYFFGSIDDNGAKAIDFFSNFSHPSIRPDSFRNLLDYMSSQKLRTPKGLAWLASITGHTRKEDLLKRLVSWRNIYCAIWTESIWHIADASTSNTKFIVSDHPVTVYNRACSPKSSYCRGFTDPDIRLHGTHTIFPLSLNKVLILTNLSWIRNPYQSETKSRPNPNMLRDAMFNFMDIQTGRMLDESEVLQVNYIIKQRAYGYLAAAREEWLYPEKYMSRSLWKDFGSGYLLMPDPRSVNYGGEIMWGNYDGSGGAIDPYGRRPWEPEYNKETNSHKDFGSLYKFKGEFAHMFGPHRRGTSFDMGSIIETDSEKMHAYHLSLYKQPKNKTV